MQEVDPEQVIEVLFEEFRRLYKVEALEGYSPTFVDDEIRGKLIVDDDTYYIPDDTYTFIEECLRAFHLSFTSWLVQRMVKNGTLEPLWDDNKQDFVFGLTEKGRQIGDQPI